MYEKLFKASKLSNHPLCTALGINHKQRQQFQQTKKVDFERFVTFGKKLGFNDAQLTEMVVEGVREILTLKQ
jgi:hypothetical protein